MDVRNVNGKSVPLPFNNIVQYPNSIVNHKYIKSINIHFAIQNILKRFEEHYYYNTYNAIIYIKNNFNGFITENLVKNVHRIITADTILYSIGYEPGIFRPNKCDMFFFTPTVVYMAPRYDVALSNFSKLAQTKIDTLEQLKSWYEEFERLHLFLDNNGKTGRTIFVALSKQITGNYWYPKDIVVNN